MVYETLRLKMSLGERQFHDSLLDIASNLTKHLRKLAVIQKGQTDTQNDYTVILTHAPRVNYLN